MSDVFYTADSFLYQDSCWPSVVLVYHVQLHWSCWADQHQSPASRSGCAPQYATYTLLPRGRYLFSLGFCPQLNRHPWLLEPRTGYHRWDTHSLALFSFGLGQLHPSHLPMVHGSPTLGGPHFSVSWMPLRSDGCDEP